MAAKSPDEHKTEGESLAAEGAALAPRAQDVGGVGGVGPVLDGSQGVALDWRRLHLLQIQPVRDLLVVGLVIGIFWLGYVVRSVTVPMLLALALAYLFEPVVQRVTRKGRMSRQGAAVSIIVLFVLLVTVPLGIGVGFATVQGLEYSQRFSVKLDVLQASLANPGDTRLEDNLRRQGRSWLVVKRVMQGIDENSASGKARRELETKARIEAEARMKVEAAARAAEKAQGDAQAELLTRLPRLSGGALVYGPPEAPAGPGVQPDGGAGGGADRVGARGDAGSEGAGPDASWGGEAAAPSRTGLASSAVEPSVARRLTRWGQGLLESNAQALGGVFATQFLGTSADALEFSWRFVVGTGYTLFAVFLVLFFFYFFSVNYERVLQWMSGMIPTWKKGRVLSQARMMDRVIAGFVRGRLIIMLVQIVTFTAGYWLIGAPAPLVIGPLFGLLSMIPYLGLVSIPVATIMMALNSGEASGGGGAGGWAWQAQWWWTLVAPVAMYGLIQVFDDYVLTPLIQGKTTEMDTPSILFAVLAGGALAGFYGILLAIPAAACIKILLRESFWPRFKAWSEGRVKDFLPISRYDPTETRGPAATPVVPAEVVTEVSLGKGKGGM